MDRGRKTGKSGSRAFDDVIICSNAQTLPGLIIRRPHLSSLGLFLIPSPRLSSSNNRSRPFDAENDERRERNCRSAREKREEKHVAGGERTNTDYLKMKERRTTQNERRDERGEGG